MVGRKISPDVKERCLQAIRLGATLEHAAAYAGIDRATLWRYRKNAAFATEIEKAAAQATVGWLARIEKAAADGEWTAAAWKLERRYPEIYGRRVQDVNQRVEQVVEVTVKLGERELDEPAPLRALNAG